MTLRVSIVSVSFASVAVEIKGVAVEIKGFADDVVTNAANRRVIVCCNTLSIPTSLHVYIQRESECETERMRERDTYM